MSSKDVVKAEVGRLRDYLERLCSLAKGARLDRRECLNIVSEIDRSLRKIHSAIKGQLGEEIASQLTYIASPTFSSLIYMLESQRASENEEIEIRSSIAKLCRDLDFKTTVLEIFLGPKWALQLISELISEFPSFTESRAVAVVYLSAMEIAVKRALMVRGMEVKERFEENVEKLIDALRSKDEEVKRLKELLPPVFWEIRNRVMHEGYSPSNEELEMIVKYVKRFMRKIEPWLRAEKGKLC